MKVITTQDITDTLRGLSNYVVLDFWAAWCGPCRKLSDVLDLMELEFPNIHFYKINVDENGELAREYNIMSIPTLVILKDGVEIQRIIGAKAKDEISRDLSKLP